MADILSDIYPVPVSFVDGQQPTARFLNAWAAQIDIAFAVLARIIGDFDGESSEQATYISNLVRTIGSMGWLDSRLPRGLKYGLADFDNTFPTLIETLSIGTKETVLSFIPRSDDTTIDAGTISGWQKVNVGSSTNPGLRLSAVNQWTHWSRKVYTTTNIPDGAKIQYEVDPDSVPARAQDYYDTYGPNSGANVVPNIYEIASVVAGGQGAGVLSTLCTYGDADDQHWIEFPNVRRAMNPALPFNTSNNIPLDLRHDAGGTVRWTDANHTPRYTVPPYIYDLAFVDVNRRIPDGMCSLWIANGTTITRLVNQNSEEQIRFFIDDGDRRHVRIELPDGYVLPHQEVGQEALISRYIVAFAGVGIADAIAHTRARIAKHSHDGAGEDNLVRAVSISERFNPGQHTQSKVPYNHYPQYLLRTGFSNDSDVLNDNNAFMGNLLITRSDKVPGDGDDPDEDFLGLASFSLYFGSTGGPRLLFDGTDTGGFNSPVGKFVIKDMASIFPVRLRTPDLFLGTETTGLQLHWSAINDVLSLSDANEIDLTPDGIGIRLGTLILADGKISFEDAETVDSLVPATLTFEFDDPTPTWTLARSAEIWNPRTRLQVGEVYTNGIVNHDSNTRLFKWIGPEGWVANWKSVEGDNSATPTDIDGPSPWTYESGFGSNPIVTLDVGLISPPYLKGRNSPATLLKVLRRVINLDPLVSAANAGDASGLILKNIDFIFKAGDNSGLNSDNFYKAYVRRCRMFNDGSFVFDATTETVFASPNRRVNAFSNGYNKFTLLDEDSSHEFNFKEYTYTVEFLAVDNDDGNAAVNFDFYGCRLSLCANFIG